MALDELFHLAFVCEQISSDIGYDESLLIKRNKKWPDIPPVTNEGFNNAVSGFLGTFQLCRAVDIYNWYCQKAFNLALKANPKMVIAAPWKEGKISKVIEKARKGRKDAEKVVRDLLAERYTADKHIREAIHRNLDIMQNPEIELLCTCRNVLVHKLGCDENNEIRDAIKTLGNKRALFGAQWYLHGHMPITLNSGNLVINQAIGNWTVNLMQQQIFMMDQNFAHVYKLPRKVWERKKISRNFLGAESKL